MSDRHEAKVAVIMPCHNGERTLAQAIESVLQQTFQDWELVLSMTARRTAAGGLSRSIKPTSRASDCW